MSRPHQVAVGHPELIRNRFHDKRTHDRSNEEQEEDPSDWQLSASHVRLGHSDEIGDG